MTVTKAGAEATRCWDGQRFPDAEAFPARCGRAGSPPDGDRANPVACRRAHGAAFNQPFKPVPSPAAQNRVRPDSRSFLPAYFPSAAVTVSEAELFENAASLGLVALQGLGAPGSLCADRRCHCPMTGISRRPCLGPRPLSQQGTRWPRQARRVASHRQTQWHSAKVQRPEPEHLQARMLSSLP